MYLYLLLGERWAVDQVHRSSNKINSTENTMIWQKGTSVYVVNTSNSFCWIWRGSRPMFLKITQISNVEQSMALCKFVMFDKMLQYLQVSHKLFLFREMPCSFRISDCCLYQNCWTLTFPSGCTKWCKNKSYPFAFLLPAFKWHRLLPRTKWKWSLVWNWLSIVRNHHV